MPLDILLKRICIFVCLFAVCPNRASSQVAGQAPVRTLENLGRGLVAIYLGEGKVFLSWRLLNRDHGECGFHLYRTSGDEQPIRVQPEVPLSATCYEDTVPDLSKPTEYTVRTVVGGVETDTSQRFRLVANPPVQSFLTIPLKTPLGFTPNDCSVGDLDADGEYEIIVHMTGRGRDNSQAGLTDTPIFQAYKLDGTMLWEINLGKNIREGAHYTPFLVYDFDGDGRAEFLSRTADGTVDGTGQILGDGEKDFRSQRGYVLDGPEFVTVFDGLTGKMLASEPYVPARGKVSDWGDNYGNRVDRFLAGVAFLDGEHPSAVFCRGYYTRTVLTAWDWRDGQLSQRWVFDSDDGSPEHRKYRGQGDHSLSVADVDGDGRDDIIYGACCIGSNGKGLYSTGFGHGDALHCSAFDPSRTGLQVFNIHEKSKQNIGVTFRDAETGEAIWTKTSADVGRGLIADLDPKHSGAECWASGPGLSGLWNCVRGEVISERKPRSCNFAIWWDGDLLREILDRTSITKWDWENQTEVTLLNAPDCAPNNSSKSTPCLSADILGDWREEVIWRTADNQELRIYTTSIPTDVRLITLMHDRQYRMAVAWQNVGYNQPPHPSFFIGHGMKIESNPNVKNLR
jgi:rhamnogalacturonan endolyase